MALIEAGFTAEAVTSFCRAVNSHEALLKATKTLMESTRHAYNCPELKSGGTCNCGFHEAIAKGSAAIGQAEAEPTKLSPTRGTCTHHGPGHVFGSSACEKQKEIDEAEARV